MKVIIVGGGISGLSCAIAMNKYILDLQRHSSGPDRKLKIKIYDKPDGTSPPMTTIDHSQTYSALDQTQRRLKNQGAAISLQKNALRVLSDLDPELARQVMDAGYPCSHFTWKTGGNWVLGRRWFDVLLPISRPVLVQVLMDKLLHDHDSNVEIGYKNVTAVKSKEGLRPAVIFEDGTLEQADLVIGADGIHSSVRKSLLRAKDGSEIEEFKPQYLGQCGVGGVLQRSIDATHMTEDSAITFIVDSDGVFGYCPVDPVKKGRILYFSFYDSDLPPRGTKGDRDLIGAQLRHRHAHWADPVVKDCIDIAELDNIWPSFYIPDLPHWGQHGVVLVGDAAHAMPAATGQGGSQALEDGQTLGLLLASFLERSSGSDPDSLRSAIEDTIKGFYNVRHERVEAIKAKGLRLREPPRPWPWFTRMSIFLGLFVIMRIEQIRSWFGYEDQIFKWNVQEQVEAYMATR